MEISVIPKSLSRKTANTAIKDTKAFFKPNTCLRKVTVAKPFQQKLDITAYSPKNYFKDRIADMFQEMRSTYGNIPLWIKYSMFPSSVSWNLGSVQATHSLHVYGEEQYVKEFLSRLYDIIRNDRLNSLVNGIGILEQGPSKWVPGLLKNDSNEKLLPTVLQKKANSTTLRSGLLGASGLIAGLAGIVLALSFFSSRRSSSSKQHVSRKNALQAAINSVSKLTSTTPILENEEFTGNSWRFKLSNYIVAVDTKGVVTSIRKVGEND